VAHERVGEGRLWGIRTKTKRGGCGNRRAAHGASKLESLTRWTGTPSALGELEPGGHQPWKTCEKAGEMLSRSQKSAKRGKDYPGASQIRLELGSRG